MKKFIPSLVALALFSVAAFAQNNRQLPANYLSNAHVKHDNNVAQKVSKKKGNFPTPHNFPAGVDTLVNFTDHFQAAGVFYDGTPHHIWEYSMVGNKPSQGGATTFNAPVIPVSVELDDANGNALYTYDVTPFIQPFMNGPVFGEFNYSSSPTPTQFVDAVQRAEFGNHANASWHTLLAPSVQPTLLMKLPPTAYYYALNSDGSCCAFVLVDENVFNSLFFPPSTPDNTTIIGAAEVNGYITTKDISTFMFPNTYLYQNGDVNQCCVLGYHSFDEELGTSTNGNELRFYVLNYSSWISPGLFSGGFQDVTAHSHEMSEIFNDPFVGFDGIHNITPFWLNPAGQCQDIMEVGDVIEDLPNPTYPITINGFTYHPQTEALLPWFEFQANSSAINHAYSYPDETVLTTLSAPQPLDCNGQ